MKRIKKYIVDRLAALIITVFRLILEVLILLVKISIVFPICSVIILLVPYNRKSESAFDFIEAFGDYKKMMDLRTKRLVDKSYGILEEHEKESYQNVEDLE